MVAKHARKPKPEAPQLERRRFTADEYERMIEAGILNEDERVELLKGEIVCMVPSGVRHVTAVNRQTNLFSQLLRMSSSLCRIPFACNKARSRSPISCCCARVMTCMSPGYRVPTTCCC